jgi:sec-independent protein translocase protein TatA
MFGIGMPELIVVLVIIMIEFGARKLPEIGSGIGKGIRNFKKSVSGDDAPTEQIEDSQKDNGKEKK